MVESMVNLLSYQPAAATASCLMLPPAHLLALLDPEAGWLAEWFHSRLARSHLLASLGRCGYSAALMDSLIRPLEVRPVEYWNAVIAQQRQVKHAMPSGADSIADDLLQAVVFLHNLSVVGKMARYRQAWALLSDQDRILKGLVNLLSSDELDLDLGQLLAARLRLILGTISNPEPQLISILTRLASTSGLKPTINLLDALTIPQLLKVVTEDFLTNCHQSLLPDTSTVTPALFAAMTSVIEVIVEGCQVRNSTSGEALIEAYAGRALSEPFCGPGHGPLVQLLKKSPGNMSRLLLREEPTGQLHQLVAANIQVNPSLLVHFPDGLHSEQLLERQLEKLWQLLAQDRVDIPFEDAAADGQLLDLFCTAVAPHGLAGGLMAHGPLETEPGRNERLQLPAYHVALLRLLAVAAANLDTRAALLADFDLKARIDRELEACYAASGELVVDEAYLQFRYLRGWLAGLGGPLEAPLPDLELPGERSGHPTR